MTDVQAAHAGYSGPSACYSPEPGKRRCLFRAASSFGGAIQAPLYDGDEIHCGQVGKLVNFSVSGSRFAIVHGCRENADFLQASVARKTYMPVTPHGCMESSRQLAPTKWPDPDKEWRVGGSCKQ